MGCTGTALTTHQVPFEEHLYQTHLDPIYRYIYSKVGNQEEAEDLTAQVFLKAVRGLDGERSPASIRQWLFQVARTTVADYWRRWYGLPAFSLDALLTSGWQGPPEKELSLPDSGPETQVAHILEALPERYREVLTCRFLLALSVRDTARKMGLTEQNVKVLQFRALKRAAALEEVPD